MKTFLKLPTDQQDPKANERIQNKIIIVGVNIRKTQKLINELNQQIKDL